MFFFKLTFLKNYQYFTFKLTCNLFYGSFLYKSTTQTIIHEIPTVRGRFNRKIYYFQLQHSVHHLKLIARIFIGSPTWLLISLRLILQKYNSLLSSFGKIEIPINFAINGKYFTYVKITKH